jgi:hypothetical protein
MLELTDSNKEEVTNALVDAPVLMFCRTGAPNPIDESCLLYILKQEKKHKYITKQVREFRKEEMLFYYYLSEIVFSKSTKAPPQTKRISFVSIYNKRCKSCIQCIALYGEYIYN